MSIYYFDTSTLVKNYVTEPGSPWVRHILSGDEDAIFIGQMVLPEVVSALAILARQGRITRKERDSALDRFLKDVTSRWHVTALTRSITDSATLLTQEYPLKGYDAVHLSTALDLAVALLSVSGPLIFVTGDKQLLSAAKKEGITTENPFDHIRLDIP